MKGDAILDCMIEKHKDKWVSATRVSNDCTRGVGYTRDYLERASNLRILETKTASVPLRLYKVDPKGNRVVCPIEPERPYEQSICKELASTIENCMSGSSLCKEPRAIVHTALQEAQRQGDHLRVKRLSAYLQSLG